MNTVDVEGEVSQVDLVHVPFELHLQHPLKTPAHEGGVREPGGHWGRESSTASDSGEQQEVEEEVEPLHVLTQPHVLQADDESSGQIEDGEERVPHEGGGLQRGQGRRHEQSHGPAAVDHQPGQQEVEEEPLRRLVQTSQPVDGQSVDQSEHAVFWKFSKDLKIREAGSDEDSLDNIINRNVLTSTEFSRPGSRTSRGPWTALMSFSCLFFRGS